MGRVKVFVRTPLDMFFQDDLALVLGSIKVWDPQPGIPRTEDKHPQGLVVLVKVAL